MKLDGLGDILGHILTDILKDHDCKKGKIPVGMVSDELRKEFCSWRESKEELELEIELQTNLFKKRMERELTERFEQRFNDMQKRKRDFWKKVHKELNISDEADLNIDPKTGVISQYVETHGNKH